MLNFRKARAVDVDEIHQIYLDAANYKRSLGDHSWRDGFSRNGVLSFLSDGNLYAGTVDGQIAVVFSIAWEDEEAWGEASRQALYLRRLAVAKNYRGQGLGNEAVIWASNHARNYRREYLRLDYDANNRGLLNYYEKLGFNKVAEKTFRESRKHTAALLQKPV